MHCQVQQEPLILIVCVYNRAHTCARTTLLGKENNITISKGLPCFIWLKWVNKGPIVHPHNLYHDTHNSFKHYIFFLISIIYLLEFVLLGYSAVPRDFCISVQYFEVLLNEEVIHMIIFSQWTSNLSTCLTAHSVQMAATCKSPQLEDKEDFLVFEGPSFVWIWPSLGIAADYV